MPVVTQFLFNYCYIDVMKNINPRYIVAINPIKPKIGNKILFQLFCFIPVITKYINITNTARTIKANIPKKPIFYFSPFSINNKN